MVASLSDLVLEMQKKPLDCIFLQRQFLITVLSVLIKLPMIKQ